MSRSTIGPVTLQTAIHDYYVGDGVVLPVDPLDTSEAGQLIKSGWVYRDGPRGRYYPQALFASLLNIIGDGNYRVLAGSTKSNKTRRAQLLVSPAGIQNLRHRLS